MTVRCVEIPKRQADLQQSHIRVERNRNGHCIVTGRIAHPDIVGLTDVPVHTCRGRAHAIEAAANLAKSFGLTEIWLLT